MGLLRLTGYDRGKTPEGMSVEELEALSDEELAALRPKKTSLGTIALIRQIPITRADIARKRALLADVSFPLMTTDQPEKERGKTMSTNDVPGANPANQDELAMGAWAEHDDGSLIFVESTEGNRVIYSIFDMSKEPIIEYRDAMPEVSFKKTFSWKPGGMSVEKWTWHDKTPFPWDRIIKAGAKDGLRHASARDTLTAAERVANSLKTRGQQFDQEKVPDRDRTMRRIGGLLTKLGRAINELRE